MAGSVNRVILIGHCGRDPEVRSSRTGGAKFANFSIATTNKWRDRETGERKEATHWHRIVTFSDDLAREVEATIRKGSLVQVIGELQNRKWTDDKGVERYVTEIVVDSWRGSIANVDRMATRSLGEGGGPPPAEGPEAYGRPAERRPDAPRQQPTPEVPF